MGQKPARKFSPPTRPAPKKAPVLPKAIRDEPDSEWKQWFIAVENRRRAQIDQSKMPLVFSRCEKEGEKNVTIIRRKSQPRLITTFIKMEKKGFGQNFNEDLLLIEEAWKHTVGVEMAREVGIYAFKKGVLTITVENSPLLQEIRQFHKEAIEKDLRDIWPVSVPLVKINYRLGTLDDKSR